MKYWLMKSEPSSFGIEHFKNEKNMTTPWDGVRNYQARNFMRDDMSVGDGVLFYHSSCKAPGVVAIAEVASAPYPDPTAFDPKSKYFDPKSKKDEPRWIMVDIKLIKELDNPVTLEDIRNNTKLSDMIILKKGNRLSITPVLKKHWDNILKMASK